MDFKSSEIFIDKKWMDQTFPLLDKFRTLSGGSFKHCQNVYNICETIAIELGLNVDLLKVSALYHDIGKMNNPSYFGENQDASNIHDTLDPQISYQIITKHVGDSVLLLLQIPNFPIEAIQIISQHHGDTIVQAFYNKDKNANEDKYRYKCSKPDSIEALILMICDSVEATARSYYNNKVHGEEFIAISINKTIERLMNDGQLDNIKVGALNATKKILTKELESIYHKRVIYDEETTIKEIRNEKNPLEDNSK